MNKHAMRKHAMRKHAMRKHAMRKHAMRKHAMRKHAMRKHAMRKYGAAQSAVRVCVVAMALGAFAGCKKGPRPLLTCPVIGEQTPIHDAPAAGCLVVIDGKLLVVRRVDPRAGKNGRITPPGGGVESGESARCAAVRECREEAGVDVAAGALVHRFDNGFALFLCRPINDKADAAARTADVPASMRHEASEKLLLDVARMRGPGGQPERWAYSSNKVVQDRWAAIMKLALFQGTGGDVARVAEAVTPAAR